MLCYKNRALFLYPSGLVLQLELLFRTNIIVHRVAGSVMKMKNSLMKRVF